MSRSPFAAVILAAGEGTRLKSAHPKVLHEIARQPMIRHVLDALAPLRPVETVVVIGPGGSAVAAAVAPAKTVSQSSAVTTLPVATSRRQRSGEGLMGGIIGIITNRPVVPEVRR